MQTNAMVMPLLIELARPPGTFTMPAPAAERPALLRPLYVSFATLQVLDAYSTYRATERGYRELNPMLQPASNNLGAMLALKAGATAATIFAVEKLWKRNRTAAVLTMVGINAAYGFVVSHNYRQAREPGRPSAP